MNSRTTFVLLLSLASCGEAADPLPTPPVARELVFVPAPRRIASEGAFDLLATEGGAVLAWAPPLDAGAGVRVLSLSPLGAVRGDERDVSGGSAVSARPAERGAVQVDELVLAGEAGAVGLAWVAGHAEDARAEGVVSPAGVEGFGPPFLLGPAGTTRVPSARGRIAAIVGASGSLGARVRVPRRDCDHEGGCDGTRRYRLDAEDHESREPRDESVPDACEPFLVGTVASGGVYFHGLCGVESGQPSVTVFAFNPEPFHAAWATPLPGCTPLGLAPTPEGAALVATCPEGPSVAWLDAFGTVVGTARPATFSSTCVAGRPTLTVSGGAVPLSVPLTAPVSRIEGILGPSIAAPRARAVWTGSAVLVAEPRDGEVWTFRWECGSAGGVLLRSDPM